MTDPPWPTGAALQARIREVAYLLWEAAGRQPARALEYWLAAEREILAGMERRTPGAADETADAAEESEGAPSIDRERDPNQD